VDPNQFVVMGTVQEGWVGIFFLTLTKASGRLFALAAAT